VTLALGASSIGVDARVRPLDLPGNSGVHGRSLLAAQRREAVGEIEVPGAFLSLKPPIVCVGEVDLVGSGS
jgi:hypothetical protein